jgi:hypothetical protein
VEALAEAEKVKARYSLLVPKDGGSVEGAFESEPDLDRLGRDCVAYMVMNAPDRTAAMLAGERKWNQSPSLKPPKT